MRSRKPFFKTKPARYLLLATLVTVVCVLIIPFTPVVKLFGFTPLPAFFILIVLAIVGVYILSAEILKRIFYQKVMF
ncbi:MAG: cation transporting ATPase C-terminal domain-containing protein [Deltaproteobacteria bacterium]|nr:cation transporting ATPase C-terminal domain-containing protein [Deltaproteobacteria bacterium]